ncbi:RES domain-containing protein [Ilyomonas limi]|uniref:RES domain-containing protein n=1 Tax=Ilyomonas limi TaxID=2575867 RepID=A0A4U3L6Q7_9BACT|nr:RES family NAD+ phosphorylase [Ilyomonas limi]TKK70928.1 RES domain-containing protein [Ilyomonas limi]
MLVYRIVKSEKRTADLTGTGAYNEGGRWNSEGVYALYTSEHSALAMLEVLVHVDESELPPDMFIMTIAVADNAPVFSIPDDSLPANWRIPENILLKEMGDKILMEKKFVGIKVRSAVMQDSYNYVLNPLFPNYYDLVKVVEVKPLAVDKRLK